MIIVKWCPVCGCVVGYDPVLADWICTNQNCDWRLSFEKGAIGLDLKAIAKPDDRGKFALLTNIMFGLQDKVAGAPVNKIVTIALDEVRWQYSGVLPGSNPSCKPKCDRTRNFIAWREKNREKYLQYMREYNARRKLERSDGCGFKIDSGEG